MQAQIDQQAPASASASLKAEENARRAKAFSSAGRWFLFAITAPIWVPALFALWFIVKVFSN